MSADEQLLYRWSQGDEQAGRAFVEQHFEDVYRFVRGKIVSGAEDITQQVFASCVEQPERFRGEGSPRAYLLGIARRVLWNSFRSQRRYAGAVERGPVVHAVPPRSPSSVVRARQEVRVLHAALQTLDLDLQILIELQYWEGLTMNDIAHVLEIPPGTVKSRLARAREALRVAMESVAIEPDLARSSFEGLDRWANELQQLYTSDRA